MPSARKLNRLDQKARTGWAVGAYLGTIPIQKPTIDQVAVIARVPVAGIRRGIAAERRNSGNGHNGHAKPRHNGHGHKSPEQILTDAWNRADAAQRVAFARTVGPQTLFDQGVGPALID